MLGRFAAKMYVLDAESMYKKSANDLTYAMPEPLHIVAFLRSPAQQAATKVMTSTLTLKSKKHIAEGSSSSSALASKVKMLGSSNDETKAMVAALFKKYAIFV